MSEPTPVEREDEDDHDLLTYGEAGFRLYEAVRDQRALVQRLREAGSPGVDAAETRLSGLQEAADRNSRQPINDENFERFFGYPGFAKRNTKGQD
ncbi:hypothetical protein QWJ41_06740 [Nocardioides sp. SOB44]|uniref:Acyl-CoA synthetase n=1 Tax=Nocardioides cremeus TaxID=3058044 RepID=A0ABT8TN66_9ACTN|nr:hypothetical protein [Nocardioides cremeus]MDO3395406.1 hypothetical protein [Nocardioides cremeus]